ncbi:MAG TPA: hypothetical protein VGM79_29195 [Streptosporangiaceae bacterium]
MEEIQVEHCPRPPGRGAALPRCGRSVRRPGRDRVRAAGVAEIRVGDLITAASGRLPVVAIVRRIGTVPGGRVLYLEVPGLPQFSWPVEYAETECVERHS